MPHPQNKHALAVALAAYRKANRLHRESLRLAREGQVTWRKVIEMLKLKQVAQDNLTIVQRLVGEDK